jgi:ligand-binding sensor domain-containing protein
MKKLWFFLLFIYQSLNIYCQYPEINIEHISVQQGIPDNEINCIKQDHIGFIWIGGSNGLYKYDGYDFTYFRNHPGCNECPSYKKVFAICEDNLGLLWILSDAGISLFNPENEKSRLVYPILWDSTHVQLDLNNCMLRDSKGNIWASCQTGLIKISYLENEIPVDKDSIFKYNIKDFFKIDSVQLSNKKYSPDNRVLTLYEDAQKNIWVGCIEGIFILKNGSHDFARLDIDINKGIQQVLWSVRGILQIDENAFWIISANDLCIISNVKTALRDRIPDVSSLHFSRKMIKGGLIALTLSKDRQQNFLLGTTKELYIIKKK